MITAMERTKKMEVGEGSGEKKAPEGEGGEEETAALGSSKDDKNREREELLKKAEFVGAGREKKTLGEGELGKEKSEVTEKRRRPSGWGSTRKPSGKRPGWGGSRA